MSLCFKNLISFLLLSNTERQEMEKRSYKQNYTPRWMYDTTLENRQCLAMMKNPKKQTLVDKVKTLEQSMILINDLGFNLYVAPQSLVIRLIAYFGIKVSYQNRGSRNIEQRLKQIGIELGPIDINLQTKELYCNYSVLIGSSEQEKSSLLCYPTIVNFQENYQEK